MAARVATHRRGLGSVLTLIVLALTGTACAATSGSAPPAAGPVVVTDAGPIRGTAAGGVDGYLGVPYAAPPVDELRWAPPVPPAPWTEERAATSFGSPCPADDSFNGPRSEIEDCLFLNVWRLAGAAPGELRPVLASTTGSASSDSWRTRCSPQRRASPGTSGCWISKRRCAGCSATSPRSVATRPG